MSALRLICNSVARKPHKFTSLVEAISVRTISSSAIQMKTFKQMYQQFWSDPAPQPPWKHCCQIGDPVLRQVTTDVPVDHIKDDAVQQIIKQMTQTMRNYNLVGISANQIGVEFSIIVMEVRKTYVEKIPAKEVKAKELEIFPLTIVINPKIKVIDYNKKIFAEGCASVCGYMAEVARFTEVELTGHNENAEPVNLRLKGWTARIAQHETDHLKGQIFTDIMDRKTFACSTWEAINFYGGKLHIPFYPKK